MIYFGFLFYPKWKQNATEATISWDVSGYYMYLPAIFIYDDIKEFKFMDSILVKYQPTPNFQQVIKDKNSNNYVIKYTIGHSITMLPFFLIADNYCKYQNYYPRDGYSYPYQIVLGIGMFLYSIIGLIFLRKILLIFFSDIVVAITIPFLVIGTNYLDFSSIDHVMTHSVLFTLYTLLIYLSNSFYKKQTIRKAIFIGIILGLQTLIRPTEIIAFIIPVLWGTNSIIDIKKRYQFIKSNYIYFLIALIFSTILCLLQPIYWYYVTGKWFVYSYDEQGFSWLHPHFILYCFSYRCGWLMYSPLMFIPIIGSYFWYKLKLNNLPILLFLAINFYIIISWDVWDYGGTSSRAIMQSYAVFAFTFAAFISWMNKSNLRLFIFIPILVLLSYINLWWTLNSRLGNVQVSFLSKEYYWNIIGRWKSNEFINNQLDNKDSYYGYPTNYKELYFNDFENENNLDLKGSKFMILSETVQATPSIYIEKFNEFKWIRVSADITFVEKEWDIWKMSQFIIKVYDKNNTELKANSIRVQRFINQGENKNIFIDLKVPENSFKLETFLWNAESKKTIYIDNFKIIGFND